MITSPGAVWHAIVRYGLLACTRLSGVISPATRNMQVRGPVPSTHARKLPVPESLRLVTSMITPPRPPTAPAPPPSAVGNAAIAPGFKLTALTFTCADADLLASASLVAVTVSVPALAGAV